MYNISDFLHFPARNKMHEGAARVYFISAGKWKKSEMLFITWLNVVGVIPFITFSKSKIYWQGVKSTASGKTAHSCPIILNNSYNGVPPAPGTGMAQSQGLVLFTPCQYILLFSTVIKVITKTIFNHIMYNIFYFLLVPAKIKWPWAAPLYILFLLEPVNSQKCYTLYIVKLFTVN